MGIDTSIGWCDSTVNGQEGCDGCELWKPGDGGTCYAGNMIRRWGSSPGHPARFEDPEIYPHRILSACYWPDLKDTKRPGKPWLNGRPRMIFLDDMGDTFTKRLDDADYVRDYYRRVADGYGSKQMREKTSLDLLWASFEAVRDGGHWLDPFVEMMEESPHVWLMLTKRPRRMAKFWEAHGGITSSFWPMTSVTTRATLGRVRGLLSIPGAEEYGVSYEPARPGVDFEQIYENREGPGMLNAFTGEWWPAVGDPDEEAAEREEGERVSWLIIGGGSGQGEEVCDLPTVRRTALDAEGAGCAAYIKQLGRRCQMRISDAGPAVEAGAKVEPCGDLETAVVTFTDAKGEDAWQWPEDLRQYRRLP